MSKEEHRLLRLRQERIARTKRILRWMPRRATIHRYPVLKWFANAARKRSYLWSFRVRYAVPAIYAGCILALQPLYGIQLILALGLAFVLKANLPILASIQFITNPVTALPVYFAGFQVGRVVFHLFGLESPRLNITEMKILFDALYSGHFGMNLHYVLEIWLVTSAGGLILGTFLATVGATMYKLAAYEVDVSYKRLMELQKDRHKEDRQEQPEMDNTGSRHD